MRWPCRNLLVVFAAVLLAACQSVKASSPTATPDLTGTEAARASWTPVPVAYPQATPSPTVSATSTIPPTVLPTATATLTLTVTRSPIATNTPRPTLTRAPTLADTEISTNLPGPLGGASTTWTPLPPTRPIRDHFLFLRPIGQGYTDYWARNYSYGSTDNGTRPIHHGIDLLNETGTPVLAAANGVVYFAGADTSTIFGPQPDFYGNVIVLEHSFREINGQTLYSLYGHLSKVDVQQGQKVKVGQEIGLVGSTGVATGSHLHFEIRAGTPVDYGSTRNPELWIVPYVNHGVLAGRVMGLDGKTLQNVLVEVRSAALYRSGYSYADDTVNSDPAIQENFVIPDLPTGYYIVFVQSTDGALRFRTLAYINPSRTTWIDIYLDPSSVP